MTKASRGVHIYEWHDGTFHVTLKLEAKKNQAKGKMEVEYRELDTEESIDLVTRFMRGENIQDLPYGAKMEGAALRDPSVFGQITTITTTK